MCSSIIIVNLIEYNIIMLHLFNPFWRGFGVLGKNSFEMKNAKQIFIDYQNEFYDSTDHSIIYKIIKNFKNNKI